MNIEDKTTEQRIKDSATAVFLKDGFEGARMQEIADAAGVNKAMLHYYFSNKENLFESVFKDAVSDFIPKIKAVLESKVPLIEKIETFVILHMEHHKQNPTLASFVFYEMLKNPERMAKYKEMMDEFNFFLQGFIEQYNQEVEAGILRKYSPFHLFVIIQSMTDYFILAKPFVTCCFSGESHQNDETFETELTLEIIKFIKNAILISNE